MKHLFTVLVALCMVGAASAQHVTPTVPPVPATPSFRAPVGIKDVPRSYSNDAPWKNRGADTQATYTKALDAYNAATHHRPAPSQKAPVDCDMIIWADTTVVVPMPTLTPDPDVDLNMPVLTPDQGCSPPVSVKRRPDARYTPRRPLKKYPMRIPRR